MKTNITILIILFLGTVFYAQNTSETNIKNGFLGNLDTWTVGAGLNNTIVHGDLTSVYAEDSKPINLGFYIYVDKMLSAAFGFEFKIQTEKLRGSSQDLSTAYQVLYTDNTAENLYFEGNGLGYELNGVINLNGLSKNYQKNRKLNFIAYLGLGYHSYSSKLYNLDTDALLVDYENFSGRSGKANSIYYTTGLGLRYNLSNKIDLELRQTVNFNNEDHLDAAITSKQVFETFFTTNLGVVYKFNKTGKSIIWQDNKELAITEVDKNKEIEAINSEEIIVEELDLKDSDGDGVIDQLDKEPNTVKGAVVYGNGIAIDTDRDGIIDLNDKCPLVQGSKANNGCPTPKDTDKDGILDKDDMCPTVFGLGNDGCPLVKKTPKPSSTTIVSKPVKKEEPLITENDRIEIEEIANNIYFKSGKSYLVDSSKRELDKISEIIASYPNLKFIIEGHTDSGGKRLYNLRLSQDRANAVKNYLVNLGTPAYKLKAIGYGFSKPRRTNKTSDGKQMNRRVEIRVSKL